MSRPFKKGLEYFSIDCNPDSKLEYIEAIHGLTGFAIVVKLWQDIYKEEGYFIEWNKKSKYLFCKNNQVEIILVESVLETCFEESIFSREKFEAFEILTSKGVQKRYAKICRDSKRKNTKMESKYIITGLITELMSLNPELTIDNPELSTQSKGKESKEEERTEKEKNGVDFEKMGFIGKARYFWQMKFKNYVWRDEDDPALVKLENDIKKFIQQNKRSNGLSEYGANKDEVFKLYKKIISNPPEFYADKMTVSIVVKKFNEFIAESYSEKTAVKKLSALAKFKKDHPQCFDNDGNAIDQGYKFRMIEGVKVPILKNESKETA
jgi:hypothetical protein